MLVLVDQGFQLRFAFFFVLAGIAVAAMVSLAGWSVSQDALTQLDPAGSFGEVRNRFFWMLATVTFPLAALLGVLGILISHRIAGPVYAVTKQLEKLSHGELPRPRALRKSDELKELVEVFHKSMDALRAQQVDERFKLEVAMAKLTAVSSQAEVKEALALLQGLKDAKTQALGSAGAKAEAASEPGKEGQMQLAVGAGRE